jgi:hypothetical protein
LPEFVQKIWVAHNVAPDGKVSKELLMSQMEAKPAPAKAPEAVLEMAVDHLQKVSSHFLRQPMLRDHPSSAVILKQIHRFQGDGLNGIYRLAKELTRFVVDRIDQDLLKKIDPGVSEKLGSIKRIEHYFTSKNLDGRRLTAPLAGIYELRHHDAHLLSAEFKECLGLLEVGESTDYQKMAKQIIYQIAITVGSFGNLIISIHQPTQNST